jgi:hypothetical protein
MGWPLTCTCAGDAACVAAGVILGGWDATRSQASEWLASVISAVGPSAACQLPAVQHPAAQPCSQNTALCAARICTTDSSTRERPAVGNSTSRRHAARYLSLSAKACCCQRATCFCRQVPAAQRLDSQVGVHWGTHMPPTCQLLLQVEPCTAAERHSP